jgi:hypothetical protein
MRPNEITLGLAESSPFPVRSTKQLIEFLFSGVIVELRFESSVLGQ